MKPRSLKLRLDELVKATEPNIKSTALAEALGISDTTLRKYMRNQTLSLERRVIEKACDYFGVGIGELLELVPCDFFPPDNNSLTLLRGTRSVLDEFGAIDSLRRFFGNNGVTFEERIVETVADITARVWSESCLIVGSPRSNVAGEVALCELFQAAPLDTSKENRRKLPLVMQVPPDWQPPAAPALIQTTKQGPRGTQCQILAPESNLGEPKTACAFADYYPNETLVAVDAGRDFGVIFIADHPTKSDVPRSNLRTYWIGGFGSVGVQAATLLLESDFRSFSIESGGFILAVVQTTYSKLANSLDRKLLQEPKVVHTIRGRLPDETRSVGSVPQGTEGRNETGASETSVSREAQNYGRVDDRPIHRARRQRFRLVVKKTWRADITDKEMPVLMEFYERELRDLPEESFASTLVQLEKEYGTISQDRRPKRLDRYLQSVIKIRDRGLGGLFSDR